MGRKDVVESACNTQTHARCPGKYLEIYTPVCMNARMPTYLYIGPGSAAVRDQWRCEVAGRLVSAWVAAVRWWVAIITHCT